LNKNDMIIAVMGPTGSGKSTFIKTASGAEDIVGHSLQSCTTEITSYEVLWDMGDSQISIIFVDTPGFDDTTKSDTEILKLISNWLKETYGYCSSNPTDGFLIFSLEQLRKEREVDWDSIFPSNLR